MKLIKLLSLFIFLASCGLQELSSDRSPRESTKTSLGQAFCDSTSLIADMSLSGHYIYNLLHCASNESEGHSESLDQVLATLDKIQPSGIQNLIDFSLYEGENLSFQKQYPYLTVLNTIVDRGAQEPDGKLRLNQTTLSSLQPLLLSFDPTLTVSLVKHWLNEKSWGNILESTGKLIEDVPDTYLRTLLTEVLSGSKSSLGYQTAQIAHESLQDDSLFASLEKTAGEMLSLPVTPSVKSWSDLCLNASSIISTGTVDLSCINTLSRSSVDAEIGITKLIRFQNEKKRSFFDRGIEAAADALKELQNSLESQKFSTMESLFHPIKNYFRAQSQALSWAMSVVYTLLDSSASDLEPVSRALDDLREDKFKRTLEQVDSLARESVLVDELYDIIIDGRQIRGCNGLKILPLGAAKSLFEAQSIMSSYLNKHDSCNGMTPMARAISDTLSIETDCITYPLLCAQSELGGFSRVDKQLDAIERELIQSTLTNLKAELETDPYYLWALGLASGAIDADAFSDALVQSESTYRTLDDVLVLEESLQASLPNVLVTDFLEKLITHRVVGLNAVAGQFSQLFDEANPIVSENRAARLFLGVYPGGPIEQVLSKNLTHDNPVLRSLLSSISRQDQLSYLLRHVKDSEAAFTHPGLPVGSPLESNTIVMGGSLGAYPQIGEDGKIQLVDRGSQVLLGPDRLWSGRDSLDVSKNPSWALWSHHYNGFFASRDVPLKGQEQHSFGSKLTEVLETSSFWSPALLNDNKQLRNLPYEFFNVEPYSILERRIMALYYMENYARAPVLWPKNFEVHGNDRLVSNQPWRVLLNLGVLMNPSQQSYPWWLFRHNMPERVGGNYPFINQFDWEEFRNLRYQNRNKPLSSMLFNEPAVQTLSSLNLLTLSGRGRKVRVQAAISFGGDKCTSDYRGWSPEPCPVELLEDDGLAYKQEDFLEFINKSYLTKLCPLISAGPLWEQQLQLNSGLCNFGESMFEMQTYTGGFPLWHGSRVLSDIWNLGKNPKLKANILNFPRRIKYQKLIRQEWTERARWYVWLKTAWSPVSPEASRIDYQRLGMMSAYRPEPVSGIESYLSLYRSIIGSDIYDSSVRSIAKHGAAALEGTKFSDILDLLAQQLESSMDANHSLLETVLRINAQLWQKPEYIDYLVHVFVSLDQPLMQEFIGLNFPSAWRGLFGDEFSWDNRGFRIVQLLSQMHVIDVFSSSIRSWRAEDMRVVLNTFNIFLKSLGNVKEQLVWLEQLLSGVSSLPTSYIGDQKDPVLLSLSQSLKSWAAHSPVSHNNFSWKSLLHIAVHDQPINQVSWIDLGSKIVSSFVWFMPNIIESHLIQNKEEENYSIYLRKLLSSYTHPLLDQRSGTSAMNELMLLLDARLDSKLLERSFLDKHFQLLSENALNSLMNVDASLWRGALNQGTLVLRRMSPVLRLIQRKASIEGEGQQTFSHFISAVSILGQNHLGVLDQQLELGLNWLDKVQDPIDL